MSPAAPFAAAVSKFGASLKAKLPMRAISGAPEDQLRAALETLLHDLVDVLGFTASKIVAIGESSLSDLKTRPDYAVTRQDALVGFSADQKTSAVDRHTSRPLRTTTVLRHMPDNIVLW